MLLLFSTFVISAQSSKKVTPLGKWNFEAPSAPPGYNLGVIEISRTDGKYQSTISFTGNDYKIYGDKTIVNKEIATFNVIVDGNDVAISLKAESATKMTGKAVYFEGEIPITLTRVTPKK